MGQPTKRLRRYLDEELGECRDEDIDSRLDDLAALDAQIDTHRIESETDVLAALANETRYTIVRALVAARGELCVCELQPLVDVSESGMSHALSELVDAGLLEGRKDGRWRKYRATNRAIAIVTVVDGSVGPAEAGDSGNERPAIGGESR